MQKIGFNIILVVLIIHTTTVASIEKDYTQFVKNMAQLIKTTQFKHQAYNRLAFISDTYGPRLWGSETLELVIDKMKEMAQAEGFQNVRLESVSNFTKWVRGQQSLTLLQPRPNPSKLDIIGLGGSVSGDVEAQVIVVESFDQLQKTKSNVPGKIVCFNNKWIDYQHSVDYRIDGPSIAAKYGAKAMLVRSVASDSISSVHTGYMEYVPQWPKIPCAAITVQDAQMFGRMQRRGEKIVVRLILQNKFVPNANSHNLVFEIMGSELPKQVVLAGGHIDSWDTGSQTGANDDGGGFITVFEAFRLLLKNGYRPKRTLRFIAWSGQQSGSSRDGASQYLQNHLAEMPMHVAAFESDYGSSKLLGFGHTGTGKQIVNQILQKYMSILGAGYYSDDGSNGDVDILNEKGIPIFNNYVQDTENHFNYFRYHHSAGDTMSIMDADDMDSNVVGIASFLYILADLNKTVRNI